MIVGKGLDRRLEIHLDDRLPGIAGGELQQTAGRQWNLLVADGPGLDALNLAGIAGTVVIDRDAGDAERGEGLEDCRLVGGGGLRLGAGELDCGCVGHGFFPCAYGLR
jgi:hypothetical protein